MEALAVEKLRGASLLKHYSEGNDFRAPWQGRPSTARSVAADRVRHNCGGRRDTNGLTFNPPQPNRRADSAPASQPRFRFLPPSIVRALTCKASPSSCDRVSVLCKLSNAFPDRVGII
jgi:hypothetical protein